MTKKAKEISDAQRSQLVDRIITTLSQDDLDWNRGWDTALCVPRNPCTKTRYSGINRLILSFEAQIAGYTDARWMTFNNAKKNNWKIKKGAKAAYVEKWDKVWMHENDDGTVSWKSDHMVSPTERAKLLSDDEWQLKLSLQRVVPVFNGDQIEGIPPVSLPQQEVSSLWDVADRLIEVSPCPVSERMSESSYYSPIMDEIVLPNRAVFASAEDFLATLLHEMGHSTGHSSRLNRDISTTFGSALYAQEELYAELSSVFSQATLGMSSFGKTFENNAAYLKNWASALPHKDTPEYDAIKTAILSSVTTAANISDYLLEPYLEKYPMPDLDREIPSPDLSSARTEDKPRDVTQAPPEQSQAYSLGGMARDCRAASSALDAGTREDLTAGKDAR